jgi:LacI family transcriptional regulator
MHSSCIHACRERGLHVIVEELSTIDGDSLQYLENSLRQMRFEGVIVAQIADQPEILDLLDRLNIRYVRISPRTDHARSDSVTSNYDDGMRQLAQHFWELGHRRIAVASALDQWLDPIRDRLVELGCKRSQILSLPMNWQKTAGEAGRELAATVLSQRERPTAIFAFNDEVAAALIAYALGHGISVPRDLSVAGYDDADLSRDTYPSLTTVRQPFDEMIRAAVALLVEPADDGKSRQVVCPVQLIVRDSTAGKRGRRD